MNSLLFFTTTPFIEYDRTDIKFAWAQKELTASLQANLLAKFGTSRAVNVISIGL